LFTVDGGVILLLGSLVLGYYMGLFGTYFHIGNRELWFKHRKTFQTATLSEMTTTGSTDSA
jgi:hypothetical protein